MNVNIKDFAITMDIKNKGVELEVKEPNGGEHKGDLVVTKTGLIWCRGRTKRQNGKNISWNKFIEYMEAR